MQSPWYSPLGHIINKQVGITFCGLPHGHIFQSTVWLVVTPLIVFSVKPDSPKWQRAVRTLTSIGVGYGLANLGLHLNSAIRNGPFVVNNDYPWQRIWDDYGGQCANIGGDASLVFTLYVGGWIYASIYTGWWNIIWAQYHKRKTKLIDAHFKRDLLTKIVVFVSYCIAKLLLYFAIAFPFAIAGYHLLEWLNLLQWYGSFFK
ncbi:MAG: hypothetical protein ACLFU1_03740 [Alphaproteobacteria bacterium]